METTQEAIMSDEGVFHAQRRHNSRWISIKKRRVAARHNHILILDASMSCREASEQDLTSTPPPVMQVMKYLPPCVIALVALKYQGKPVSVFVENPAPAWCSLLAICVYWIMVGAMKQMTTLDNGKCYRIFSNAALAFGVLSTLSLLSTFLPYPFSLAPLIIWTPLPVALMVWPLLINKNRAKVASASMEEACLPV